MECSSERCRRALGAERSYSAHSYFMGLYYTNPREAACLLLHNMHRIMYMPTRRFEELYWKMMKLQETKEVCFDIAFVPHFFDYVDSSWDRHFQTYESFLNDLCAGLLCLSSGGRLSSETGEKVFSFIEQMGGVVQRDIPRLKRGKPCPEAIIG